MRRVHQHDVRSLAGCGARKSIGVGNPLVQQALANEAILVGTENMFADGQVILLAVDEFEGQHGPRSRTCKFHIRITILDPPKPETTIGLRHGKKIQPLGDILQSL